MLVFQILLQSILLQPTNTLIHTRHVVESKCFGIVSKFKAWRVNSINACQNCHSLMNFKTAHFICAKEVTFYSCHTCTVLTDGKVRHNGLNFTVSNICQCVIDTGYNHNAHRR